MADFKIIAKCFTCNGEYQNGPHIYGHWIPKYQIGVCPSCYRSNHDGWTTENANKIIAHLKDKNLPVPELNDKQWLPRGD